MNDKAEGDIRGEMAAARQNLAYDYRDLASGARRLADWRHHVKQHPWICIGTIAALGFLAIPRKSQLLRPDPEDLERLARKHRLVVTEASKASGQQKAARTAVTLVGNALLRAALAYAGQRFGKLGEEERSKSDEGFRRPISPR